MSTENTITDSTDWLNTPLSALTPLDAALRCQVCKDFFTTPMITSCSHTFCSLCIRRYLSQEGRCPACREADQEVKLRRNWGVEEAVSQFVAGRDILLKFAQEGAATTATNTGHDQQEENGTRPKKRRKVGNHVGDSDVGLPERRSTRSQSRRMASSSSQDQHLMITSSHEEVNEIQDSDEGSVYQDHKQSPLPQRIQPTTQPNDGQVACPCCGKRMKETFINSHLDRCMAGEVSPSSPSPTPNRSNTPSYVLNNTVPSSNSSSIPYPHRNKPSHPPIPQPDRLPTINYTLLNDTNLRRKLKELGIPNWGSKELMRKRHTEWVNLWNANCDSLRPVPKTQLLRELDKWEKTLGRQIDRPYSAATSNNDGGIGGANGTPVVMVKDFDRDAWQKSNKSDFDDLIRKAREKRGGGASTATAAATIEEEKQDGDGRPAEGTMAMEGLVNSTLAENSASAEKKSEEDAIIVDKESSHAEPVKQYINGVEAATLTNHVPSAEVHLNHQMNNDQIRDSGLDSKFFFR